MKYDEVIRSAKNVLVEFYASWCPHCQRMMPVVEQVKETLGEKAAVFQFDIDREQSAADACNVRSIPTFIFYRDGVEVWRQSGELSAQALVGKVESSLE